jgi:hypothetical protein
MQNTSNIDATVPADNVAVDKALLRSNFQTAKTELTLLFQAESVPRRLAFGISVGAANVI